VLGRHTRPYEVRSRWWNGAGHVPTFAPDELMATKLRALYQRRKGRDLFDLWHVLTTLAVNDKQIVRTMTRYMGANAFTFPELRANLKDKLEHPDFRDDLNTLVVTPPDDYDLTAAADLLMERLGPHLKNAPGISEIANGAWRG
jgi:hypothetical protein